MNQKDSPSIMTRSPPPIYSGGKDKIFVSLKAFKITYLVPFNFGPALILIWGGPKLMGDQKKVLGGLKLKGLKYFYSSSKTLPYAKKRYFLERVDEN